MAMPTGSSAELLLWVKTTAKLLLRLLRRQQEAVRRDQNKQLPLVIKLAVR